MKLLDYIDVNTLITEKQYELIDKAYIDQLLEPFPFNEKSLFRLSFADRTGKIYDPEIPQHRASWENDTIERVCFADTIEGCFRAIPGSGNFVQGGLYKWPATQPATMFVHVPVLTGSFMDAVRDGFVAYPHPQLVPDAYMTQEVWVMCPVRVECIAKIHIWYDATGNPDFSNLDELPVRTTLEWCNPGDEDLMLDSLFEHPDYAAPMYE